MITLFSTKYKVRILYKSGNSHEMWVKSLDITMKDSSLKGATLTGAKWEIVNNTTMIMFLNVDQIEAIFKTDSRVNLFKWLGLKFKSVT